MPLSFPSKSLSGLLLVLGGAVFFSTKAIFVKLAYAYGIAAVPLLALRMLFAAPVFMATVWCLQKKTATVSYSARDLGMTVLLGAIGYYVSSLLDFLGLQHISAGLERLTLFLYPTFVILFSALFLHLPIQMRDIRALVFCYIGIVLAFTGEMHLSTSPKETVQGTVLVIAAAITYAVYLMGNGIYVQKLGSIRFTAYAMISACATITVHFLLFYKVSDLLIYPLPVYGYALILALFSTVLPAFMVSAGIKIIGAGPASIASSIGPVATILLGAIFLNEPLTFLQIGGMLCVVLGVVGIKSHG